VYGNEDAISFHRMPAVDNETETIEMDVICTFATVCVAD